ncbi:hypothetical protein MESS2_1080039 [Mesorhizobium metallidurans STM 2683]|uniref:Uncharacterized protein n=1 Tax=Mesorhizobium metallidurans STM 2683 TaxID=1297569 RepID=M5EGN5_9HYPH|nr:hypothetical protein MESS2_1080039 [Mesorhizobium metallidurans STM 2683]
MACSAGDPQCSDWQGGRPCDRTRTPIFAGTAGSLALIVLDRLIPAGNACKPWKNRLLCLYLGHQSGAIRSHILALDKRHQSDRFS